MKYQLHKSEVVYSVNFPYLLIEKVYKAIQFYVDIVSKEVDNMMDKNTGF